MNPEIDNKPFEMNNINYIHVVEDSQFYTELEMLKTTLEYLKSKVNGSNITSNTSYLVSNLTTVEEDIDYILKGLDNTIKQGYKLYNSNLYNLESVE